MLALKPLTEKSTATAPRVSFGLSDDGIVTVYGDARQRTIYSIDALDLSITRHIPEDAEISGEDILVLGYTSYLYALRLGDTRMMRRLTSVSRDVVTRTRDSMFMSFDMVKYKMATLRCVIQRLTPQDYLKVEKHFVACGLRREDAVLYYLLYNNNDVQKFVKLLQTIEDDSFSLEVDTLAKEVAISSKTYSEFEKTATYWTNKRLRFIISSNRYHFTQVRNDLCDRAIAAYYWVRPFYSKLHATNYAKRGLDNASKEMIKYYNDPSRARLIKNDDGTFENVIRDITDDVYATLANFREEEDLLIEAIDAKREGLEY